MLADKIVKVIKMPVKRLSCKNNRQMFGNKKTPRWYTHCSVVLLMSLTVLSGVTGFSVLLFTVVFEVDAQGWDVSSVNLVVAPLLDTYSYFAANDDGTFYPNDRFEIAYSTNSLDETIFEEIKLLYDSSTFNMFSNSSDFGSEQGVGFFEVLPSAHAGIYSFDVELWGKRFSEPQNNPEVLAKATLNIQVVEYDPHFTLTLAYTIPSENNPNNSSRNNSNGGDGDDYAGGDGGGSSFDLPFALILRYDGNGPSYNLGQRAVIDDYVWSGFAQKIPAPETMPQMLTSNLSVANFFNQTANIQFLAQGLDTELNPSQPLLRVDGIDFQTNELPKTFFWQTNTNHTYTWTSTLQTNNESRFDKPETVEWFDWQLSIVFPPNLNHEALLQTNQTLNQDDLLNQLIEQFNSPNGTLTATPFGNTVTAVYAHNKPIENFAQELGISKNQTLHCTTQTPLYLNASERYAKLHYLLNPMVAKEIATQGFTDTLHYNLTVGSTRFAKPAYIQINFTTPYEFYDKPFNATAYSWNPTHQTWITDPTVSITTSFESAFNFTQTDILLWALEEQTTDPTALNIAKTDLYPSNTQTFSATGTIETNLKRTSPLYYNLYVEANKQQQKTLSLQRTIQINFQNNQPYTLHLNFDPSSPLEINVIEDGSQTALLMLNAPKELGGLTHISIYLITQPPPPKDLTTLPQDQLDLWLLKTLNLTLPQAQIQMPSNYTQNSSLYQYYEGSSSIFEEGTLGFWGQTQITLQKDQHLAAPPNITVVNVFCSSDATSR
jgi:hypothetical protein